MQQQQIFRPNILFIMGISQYKHLIKSFINGDWIPYNQTNLRCMKKEQLQQYLKSSMRNQSWNSIPLVNTYDSYNRSLFHKYNCDLIVTVVDNPCRTPHISITDEVSTDSVLGKYYFVSVSSFSNSSLSQRALSLYEVYRQYIHKKTYLPLNPNGELLSNYDSDSLSSIFLSPENEPQIEGYRIVYNKKYIGNISIDKLLMCSSSGGRIPIDDYKLRQLSMLDTFHYILSSDKDWEQITVPKLKYECINYLNRYRIGVNLYEYQQKQKEEKKRQKLALIKSREGKSKQPIIPNIESVTIGDILFLKCSDNKFPTFYYSNFSEWKAFRCEELTRLLTTNEHYLWMVTGSTTHMLSLQPVKLTISEKILFKGKQSYSRDRTIPRILSSRGHHTVHSVLLSRVDDNYELIPNISRKIHKYTWKSQPWERYTTDNRYMCVRWNPDYSGDITNNEAHGNGKMILQNQDERLKYYEGRFKDDVSDGIGKLVYNSERFNNCDNSLWNQRQDTIYIRYNIPGISETLLEEYLRIQVKLGRFRSNFRLSAGSYSFIVFDKGYFMEYNHKVNSSYNIIWIPIARKYYLTKRFFSNIIDIIPLDKYPLDYKKIINSIIQSRKSSVIKLLQPYLKLIPDFKQDISKADIKKITF